MKYIPSIKFGLALLGLVMILSSFIIPFIAVAQGTTATPPAPAPKTKETLDPQKPNTVTNTDSTENKKPSKDLPPECQPDAKGKDGKAIAPATGNYCTLTNLTKPDGSPLFGEIVDPGNAIEMAKTVYKFGIGMVFTLAFGYFVYAGFEYVGSDLITSKKDAMAHMLNSFIGILIALSGYTLLYTINPDILSFKTLQLAEKKKTLNVDSILDIIPFFDLGKSLLDKGGGGLNREKQYTANEVWDKLQPQLKTINGKTYVLTNENIFSIGYMLQDTNSAGVPETAPEYLIYITGLNDQIVDTGPDALNKLKTRIAKCDDKPTIESKDGKNYCVVTLSILKKAPDDTRAGENGTRERLYFDILRTLEFRIASPIKPAAPQDPATSNTNWNIKDLMNKFRFETVYYPDGPQYWPSLTKSAISNETTFENLIKQMTYYAVNIISTDPATIGKVTVISDSNVLGSTGKKPSSYVWQITEVNNESVEKYLPPFGGKAVELDDFVRPGKDCPGTDILGRTRKIETVESTRKKITCLTDIKFIRYPILPGATTKEYLQYFAQNEPQVVVLSVRVDITTK